MSIRDDRPLAVLTSIVRLEEKLLCKELERRHVPYEVLDTRRTVFRGGTKLPYGGAISREISHTRNTYATHLLERGGVRVVNDARTVSLCGDKLLTTLALEAAGLPVPRWMATLSPEGALDALDEFGYPAVVKPVIGSWGRLAARLDGHDTAETVLEHRAALSNPTNRITYVQEYVDKPDRDIKAYVFGGEVVGAIYKVSTEWRTNTKRGGAPQVCPLDDELVDLLTRASAVAGDGVLGIDVLEHRDGTRYVNEINHTPEFHGAIEVLPVDLVARYVDFVLTRLREEDT
ncbi:RimK family alpha-L-glutamate ligase [Actinophytocola oryzae]|uniref:L-2-aminoadipate N-acetyltransferase n=1 Tax=Actinophytocola oryzae TaxID=502181 RepID=A0A4R7V3E7_9PSEU|nr:RimK family alpha-L-glutamate ligase [Actinophytocola oryzae]TDV43204.1 L-2-aminoadipate N-acetyltransferase [Actinophytocola oryzae]